MSSVSLYNVPAATPPPGIVPNFIDPVDTRRLPLLTINSLFLSLMLITVIVRFYSRIFLIRSLGWDDCRLSPLGQACLTRDIDMCALAATASGLQTSFNYYSVSLGYGNHEWDIRASILANFDNVRMWNVPNLLYTLGMYSVKVSILLLLFRIFAVENKLRIAITCGIAFISMAYSAILSTQIASLIQCIGGPMYETHHPVCVHAPAIQLVQSCLGVGTDIFILLLPVKSVLGLQLRTSKKIGVLMVFCTGSITCLVSIARLVSILKSYGSDLSYIGVIASILS